MYICIRANVYYLYSLKGMRSITTEQHDKHFIDTNALTMDGHVLWPLGHLAYLKQSYYSAYRAGV